MRAHFGLPSVIAEESEGRPPIHVKFEIPYFTVSGIQVYFVIIFITIQFNHPLPSIKLFWMLVSKAGFRHDNKITYFPTMVS